MPQKRTKRPAGQAKAHRGDSRPGKLSPVVQAKFLALYEKGVSVATAAKKCGVTDVAVFRLRQRDEAFARKFKEAQALSVDVMEDRMLARALNNGANKGHLTAMFGILRARNPEVWGGNTKVTHQHQGAVELVSAFTQAMQEMPNGVAAKPH